jgi:putative ABC transport system permease protein
MMRWLVPGGRRVPLGWRLLSRDRVRFAVTVAGVGLAIALVLFLAGVYGGVETESNGYVAGRPVDLWVAQNNSTNLIRSSSFLSSSWVDVLQQGSPSAASVAPLLRLITTLTVRGKTFTAFVCGIDPKADATRPTIVLGAGTLRAGEIVVDLALARRAGLSVGDRLLVQGREHRVSGISTGTNVVISQFTFVNLADAQELLPSQFRQVVSFLLVQARPGVSPQALAREIRGLAPELNVFPADEFVGQNLEELRTGLLPVLATIALFGSVVGAALLTLLLYGVVLEQREDYALLKAIGAAPRVVRLLVIRQALLAVTGGFAFGIVVYAASLPLVARFVPALAVSISLPAVGAVAAVSLAMAAAGAWLPLAGLERIYPAEVFRA